jgi:hypothetical protein
MHRDQIENARSILAGRMRRSATTPGVVVGRASRNRGDPPAVTRPQVVEQLRAIDRTIVEAGRIGGPLP